MIVDYKDYVLVMGGRIVLDEFDTVAQAKRAYPNKEVVTETFWLTYWAAYDELEDLS